MTAGPMDRPMTPPSTMRALRADPSSLDRACAKLIGATAGPAGKASVRRFQLSAREHGVDLSRFWFVENIRSGRVLAAALLAPSAGGTGMLFTSDPVSAPESRALVTAIEAVCAHPDGVTIAQSLIEPDQRAVQRAVQASGFVSVGDLDYMKRPWTPPPHEPGKFPAGVTVRPWREGDDATVVAAMDRSYIGTLDCPELCGLRETPRVLESHRGAGVWDPALWWLVHDEEGCEGVMLVNEFPDQGHSELVYLGLGPRLRGRGVGHALMGLALRTLASRRYREMTCAVDTRNTPAKRLYARHGFSAFAKRRAFVLPVGGDGEEAR